MIKITFPDNKVREYESGVCGFDIAKSISNGLAQEILSVTVNNELWDISRSINSDSTVKFHKWDAPEGKHAFWHSSAHILAEAIEYFYPGTKFGIGPVIDNGFYYDVDLPEGITLTDGDFQKLEQKIIELSQQKNPIIREDISKAEAISLFTKKNDNLKLELISELEDGTITLYKQGKFTDLCRGPHLPNTGYIKSVKILSLAGAYWRGNEKNKQLTRIYGITFPKQKLLEEYLVFLEEAKKRDHRRIGKDLELFMFSAKVGAGLPIWLPKGAALRERLEQFLKKVQKKYGYLPVITPHIGQKELYVTSGHYAKYGQDSFQPIHTPDENEEFLLKPMNCPHHCEIYKFKPRSYRDLPLRLAEFGTVYRYEQSGELHGLTRVRSFTQDDAHIFCRPDQLKEEFLKVIDIVLYIFKTLDFKDFISQISLRDPNNKEKYIGSDENWKKAEEAIIEAAAEKNLKTVVEIGEAAFYGPKLDFIVKDALGRKWQLGTIQVDYNLPERFELEYMGNDNVKHRPVMIHRAPFGSMERFVAVLIEHTAGKFPLWLTPEQVVILPISEKFNEYAKKVESLLNNYDIRTLIDDRNEKIGKKIRDNELKRIPYLLIVGEKEEQSETIAVRKQGDGDKGSMKVAEFAELLQSEIKETLKEIN
ncbi:MAG: threonine--tRNA ligase [Bacteroidetes bacterium CG02_land_8_20_14_3_00_31_25]|nr:threonine--tRNA ligase [Bacteroidota bacterium]PIV59331.1 MAG: threonine--tRNA ligase [Bacteroidetes bacterium CG02_land_8_20_14_3_00_31_25]PIX36176.1 MAG: threonine--tRNA ligase [Bacteroidetes bacterium CG_4_8_14_3_um_filter_31_14]PIY02827.1 MAG: threonine--tRNA ligase [Bacteroidetes bacterium CG_4_10_14_3_um_filter_31_20]